MYLKNKGITQTSIIGGPNTSKTFNELKWDAKYNGKNADIKFDYNQNGIKRKYEFELDNNDLNKLMNMTRINKKMPLYERIQTDFPIHHHMKPRTRSLSSSSYSRKRKHRNKSRTSSMNNKKTRRNNHRKSK